jgi:rare lipoprotein A (peptidoglycan hydrolase)
LSRLSPILVVVAALGLIPACGGGDAQRYRDHDGDVYSGRLANGPDGTRHEVSGLASWYGPGFEGRSTANGETFDPLEFTAAHRTLPFGTWVRVVDPETEKSVTVRINDRGPFKRGRVIDLSEAAAEDLDMKARGIIPVELVVLEWGQP